MNKAISLFFIMNLEGIESAPLLPETVISGRSGCYSVFINGAVIDNLIIC